MSTQRVSSLIVIGQVLAVAIFLALGYLYLISGLVVPGPFLLLLWATWLALAVTGVRFRDDVRFLVGVPAAAGLLWLGVVLGLGSILNWQA